MTKRISLALILAALLVLVLPTAAFANFAIHGNYVQDDDACAGCHRAHTSISSVTWTDAGDNTHSALLSVSSATMWQFCYACHDATGQGADTNVQQGLYEGTLYGQQGGILNGGGFESLDTTVVTSTHIYQDPNGWGAYGGGYFGQGKTGATGNWSPINNEGESNTIPMGCTTCHDPHGSSNYRILKAMVNGNYVGGYQPSANPQFPTPDGWVSSVETGWPATGFQLHTEYPDYKPSYTTPLYAKGYNMAAGTTNDQKGMSGWCAGCHSMYLDQMQTFTNAAGVNYQSMASTYNAGDGAGFTLRHRHPINVALSTFSGQSALVTDTALPLAHSLDESATHTPSGNVNNDMSDWIECLTCHRAHGTSAIMTGYAANPAAYDLPVFPSGTPSALLRLDNRGVCEACHNK